MKTRHVFVADSVPVATAAVAAAKRAGIERNDISLIASSEIEMESIPNDLKNAGNDFIPAALRGALSGGTLGLLGGVIGIVVPAVGLTVTGAAAVTLVGAAVGTWVTSLIGSMVPDEVHRRFDNEIRAGRILIVIDETAAVMSAAEAALREAGAEQLPYEATSAMTR